MEPTMEAYRIVARCDGWSPSDIDDYAAFALDVFRGEGVGCWNARGGDQFKVGSCTEYTKHGRGEDSGHAQLTSSIWGTDAHLCKLEGYCSGSQVRSSPWTSMDAAVKTFRIYGSQPWCYDARARGWHNCRLIHAAFRPGT